VVAAIEERSCQEKKSEKSIEKILSSNQGEKRPRGKD